jgi:RNA polymerase sigma factor (sigma-70 family)
VNPDRKMRSDDDVDGLMEAIRGQPDPDCEPFRVLFEKSKGWIETTARQVPGITREDAEDIVTETMLKVWRYRNRYAERGTAKAWISTIARNMARDIVKTRKRTVDGTESLERKADSGRSLGEMLLVCEFVEAILTAIDDLPHKQRLACLLVLFLLFDDATEEALLDTRTAYRKAAERMGVKEPAFRQLICQARKKLRISLHEWRPQWETTAAGAV